MSNTKLATLEEEFNLKALKKLVWDEFKTNLMPRKGEILNVELRKGDDIWEERLYRDKVKGKQWHAVGEVLRLPIFDHALDFLTPKAFKYYLGGYLLELLTYDEDASWAQGILWSLIPIESGFKTLSEMTSALSIRQLQVTALVLRCVARHPQLNPFEENFEEKLRKFWGPHFTA